MAIASKRTTTTTTTMPESLMMNRDNLKGGGQCKQGPFGCVSKEENQIWPNQMLKYCRFSTDCATQQASIHYDDDDDDLSILKSVTLSGTPISGSLPSPSQFARPPSCPEHTLEAYNQF